jgi:hypothetical protein
MKKLKENQSGIAHLGVVLLGVVVVAVIGFAGFRIYQNQNSDIDDDFNTELVDADSASIDSDLSVDEGQQEEDDIANMTEVNDGN